VSGFLSLFLGRLVAVCFRFLPPSSCLDFDLLFVFVHVFIFAPPSTPHLHASHMPTDAGCDHRPAASTPPLPFFRSPTISSPPWSFLHSFFFFFFPLVWIPVDCCFFLWFCMDGCVIVSGSFFFYLVVPSSLFSLARYLLTYMTA